MRLVSLREFRTRGSKAIAPRDARRTSHPGLSRPQSHLAVGPPLADRFRALPTEATLEINACQR